MSNATKVEGVTEATVINTDVQIDASVFDAHFDARVQREGWVRPDAVHAQAARPIEEVASARGPHVGAAFLAFAGSIGVDLGISHNADPFIADALHVYYRTPYLWCVMQHVITALLYWALVSWAPLPKQRFMTFEGVVILWVIACIGAHVMMYLYPASSTALGVMREPALTPHIAHWLWALGIGLILEWRAQGQDR
jgi:hypothetical protein